MGCINDMGAVMQLLPTDLGALLFLQQDCKVIVQHFPGLALFLHPKSNQHLLLVFQRAPAELIHRVPELKGAGS